VIECVVWTASNITRNVRRKVDGIYTRLLFLAGTMPHPESVTRPLDLRATLPVMAVAWPDPAPSLADVELVILKRRAEIMDH
jgi:hypothetical protein